MTGEFQSIPNGLNDLKARLVSHLANVLENGDDRQRIKTRWPWQISVTGFPETKYEPLTGRNEDLSSMRLLLEPTRPHMVPNPGTPLLCARGII